MRTWKARNVRERVNGAFVVAADIKTFTNHHHIMPSVRGKTNIIPNGTSYGR